MQHSITVVLTPLHSFGTTDPWPMSEMTICDTQLPDCQLLGSWLALHHNQEHHTDNGKHSECLFLPIP